MTNQQAFNKVSRHLRKQGIRAINDNGSCQYRGVGNMDKVLKCAVGCLYPNTQHKKEFNIGVSAKGLLDRSDCPKALKGLDGNLLDRLQSIHDNSLNWGNNGFNGRGDDDLRRIAGLFNLKYLTPNQKDNQ